VRVEPGARLLHGVAVFDAVDGDRHGQTPSLVVLWQITSGRAALLPACRAVWVLPWF
jgi:hypothetical protein